uniref:uncharacterized protein n=1 Tax=Myxine glutinosa TaxID=7769 RepID=UPI00358E1301
MGNVVNCCKICPKISLDRTRQDDTISLLSNEPSSSWSPVLSFHPTPEPVSKIGQTAPPLEVCCAGSSESGGSGARMPDVVQSVGTPTSLLGRNLNPFACCNPLLQGIGPHEADVACAASAAITNTGPSNWPCMVPPPGCQAQWPWVPGDRREPACGIELNPFSLNAMLAVQDWRRTFSDEAIGDVGAAGLHTMTPVAGAGEARASVPPLIYDNRLMQLVGEHGFCSGCIEAALCSHCSGSRADGLNLSRAGVPLGLSSNLGMTRGSTEASCLLASRGTIPASDGSVLHGIETEAQQGYGASLPPGFRSVISDPDTSWSDCDRPVDIGQCCGEMSCSCENIMNRVRDMKTRQGFEQTSRSVTGERATSLSDIFSAPQVTGKGKRRKKKRRGSSSRKGINSSLLYPFICAMKTQHMLLALACWHPF